MMNFQQPQYNASITPRQNPAIPQQFIQPQPFGMVYNLENSAEINNIPVSAGCSIGLCLNEGLLFIKTIQNGVVNILNYKISSMDNQSNMNANNTGNYQELNERLCKIESFIASTLSGNNTTINNQSTDNSKNSSLGGLI